MKIVLSILVVLGIATIGFAVYTMMKDSKKNNKKKRRK